MPDWDGDSKQLSENLRTLLSDLRTQAFARAPLSVGDTRSWHSRMMHGLTPPDPEYVGRFHGEENVEVGVRVGPNFGTPPQQVADELAEFEETLHQLIERLDGAIPRGEPPNGPQLEAVVAACGWVHAEWVRIHPFANGNGRTARLWANAIAMRYGLPPFVRLRPRPDGAQYASAGAAAMQGGHNPTVDHFRQMLAEAGWLSK